MASTPLSFPFGGDLEAQHGALHSMMNWLEAELARQDEFGPQHDSPVLGPLRKLADGLKHHFDYEEETGFKEATRSGTPGASAAVARLTGEHRDFLHRIGGLIEGFSQSARPDAEPDPSLLGGLRALLDDLRQHDVDEREVLRQTAGR